jgi:hypothetical protein
MDVIADLTRALAKWRRLTELESEAILIDNWPGAAAQQTQKEQLQAEIQRTLASALVTPSPQDRASGAMEFELDSVVSELMALERRNCERLAAKRDHRQCEAERLAQILHDLQGVRRAYGSSRRPHWQSYS